MKHVLLSIATAGLFAGAAQAATFSFEADLDAAQSIPAATSMATGTATVSVDDVAQTIDLALNVTGLSLDDLWDDLVAAPGGPVHFHDGVAGTTGPIAIPFAFSPSTYSDTATGFSLNVSDYSYSDAVAISGFGEDFDSFLTGLTAGEYYINIHTDTFNAGEIRGQISAVPLPASALLLMAGLGGLAGLRRKIKG